MDKPKFPVRQALFFVILVIFIYSYVPPRNASEYLTFKGSTMGTFYAVQLLPPEDKKSYQFQERVDQILVEINRVMSTYIPDSEISRWNKNLTTVDQPVGDELLGLVKDSLQYSESTSGTFDITVGTLVNLWGFGPLDTLERPEGGKLADALKSTGYQKLTVGKETLGKAVPEVQIDLSAIAKGYGVDRVGLLLESQGVSHYLVEIGGEIRSLGLSPSGKEWKVGISKPTAESASSDLVEVVVLGSGSMATSGDYRNFHSDDLGRWSHFIDPRNGNPRKSDLLSATILAPNCQMADALATVAMLLGSKDAVSYLDSRDVSYLLIRGEKDGYDFIRSKNWRSE